MKSKITFVVSIILVIAGAVIGCFAFPGADVIGFAMTLFGAGVLCSNLWKNRKKEVPSWLSILSLCLVGVGAFLCGFIGIIGADMFKEVIGYIISAVMIIIGIILPPVTAKKLEKK